MKLIDLALAVRISFPLMRQVVEKQWSGTILKGTAWNTDNVSKR